MIAAADRRVLPLYFYAPSPIFCDKDQCYAIPLVLNLLLIEED